MRTGKLLRGLSILSLILCATASFGQTPPPTPVPLITQVTPPSLSPASLAPGRNSFTLTIQGANFAPGELVELSADGWSPTPTAIAYNPTVNATGTQMVANFANVSLPAPVTLTVKVTKRDMTGAPLLASNTYYLPVTPSNQTVLLESPVTSFLSGAPYGITTGDFNGDGQPDLAVVSQVSNTVSILMGNFGFTPGALYPTGNGPYGVVAADFNGDHVLDLAITNSQDNTITILLGNGDGTFRPETTISDPGLFPTELVAADFNGDGNMDLAVVNLCGTGQYGCFPTAEPLGPANVAIFLGNGDGTFNAVPTMPATGIEPTAIAAADLNQDGFIDLVVANSTNNLTLLMGNGDGTFSAASNTPSTGFVGPPRGIAIGDFNGDGTLDVAVTSSGDNAVVVLLNQNCVGLPSPQCSLTPMPSQFATVVPAGPTAIATADMNADGLLDLVVVSPGANSVSILLGDGTGKFNALLGPNQGFPTGSSPQALALTDVNQDGRLDVVTANQSGSYSVLRQAAVMQLQLTASNSVFVYGNVPSLTVQLTPPPGAPAGPTGTISLFDGSTQFTSTTLSGYQYQIQFVLPQGYFIGAGTHQLTAVYSGDTNFAPVTSNAVTEIVMTSATTTTLSSNLSNGPYGTSVTLTASIQPQAPAPATGTVTFTDTTNSTTLGTATVSGNSAQLSLTNLGVGSHAIVATYSGDSNCAGSGSSSVSVTITQASTTTTVSASPNAAQFGQSVTLAAALQFYGSGTPTGTVTFLDGSTSLGTVNLSNNAASLSTSTLAVGAHLITAQYNGDSNFQAGSGTVNEVVNADATTTTVTSGTNPSSYGQGVVYTVSTSFVLSNLGTPAGLVTLYDGNTALSSAYLSKGSAQFTILSPTAGTHSITVQYAGTSNYAASTSVALTQTVNPSATTLSVSASPNPSSVGQSVTLYGTLQSTYGLMSTGGTITFYNNSTQLGSVVIQANNIDLENGTYQVGFVTVNTAVLPAGSQNITAKYSGDPNLQASTGSTTQTVNPAFTNVTVTANPGAPTYGQNVTFTATLGPSYGNTPTGTVTFSMNGTTLATASVTNNAASFSISTLSPGNHIVNAVYSGDANDASNTNFASITVAPPPTTTVLTSSVNPSYFNQPVVIVATPQSSVSGTPTGTMTLYDGGLASLGSTTLVSGSAQFSISSLSVGTHSFTATYSGDFNFAGSTSAALSQVVNLGPTVTSVTSLDNPMTTPYNVRFLVTATATYGGIPSGTVTLYDGSNVIGSGILTSNPNGNTVEIVVSSLTAGSHLITAKYSGSSSYGASTSSVLTQVMNLPGTTTSLSTTANPVAYGQSVTLIASLVPGTQPQGSPLPGGTVTFFDGSTSLGNGTVANNSAQITVSSLAVGSHALTAKYNGDSNYTGSTSSPFTETVNQASTTATVSSSANPAAFGQPVTFTANLVPAYGGSATGTITFLDGANSLGSATLSNNSAQFTISSLAIGAHSVTAKYSGDANFTASTSSAFAETINPAATTTAVISSLNPSAYGQSVSLTATVQPPSGVSATGTVTFFDGSNSLGSATLSGNSAQLAVSSLTTGSHSITAVYNGNSNLNGSTSVVLTQTVSQASTTTTVTANPNPSIFNQYVTFVITVAPANGGAPTGTVTLLDGSNTLVSASLSGTGTAQVTYAGLAPGAHSITAVYAGDANFTGSTSAAVSEAVNPAPSTTSVASNLSPSVYNQAVTLTATVQAPQGITPFGTVTFMDGSATLGSATLSNGSGQLTLSGLGAGNHSITASYGGDTDLTGSASAALSQSVSTASSVTTVSSSANPATFGQAVVLSVSIQAAFGGSATGTVTFLDGTTVVGTAPVSGNAAQLSASSLAVGSHSITAKYNGDANVASSTSATLTETIAQATTTATVTSGTNPAPFDESVTFSVRIQSSSSGSPTGTVTLLDGSNSLGSSSLSSGGAAQFTISGLAVGSHSISATYSGDSNFAGSTSAALTETVNQLATTTTVASSLNPAAFGQAVTLTATVQAGSGVSVAGTVTFLDGSLGLGTVTLANNSAQLATSTLAPGAHTLTVVYNSNGNFAGSTSTALTETVNQLTTTTTLASSANPALAGQAVTFTATVQAGAGNSPVGTVTFLDGSTTLGSTAVANNSAQLTISTLAPGSHSITAAYGGGTDFAASTSSSLTETVSQSSTTTTLVSNLNPATFGQAVPFVATVQTASGGAATGSVTFYDGSSQMGTATVSNNGGRNVAQFTFSGLLGGTHAITATYSGDANYTASTSGALTETINPAGSTVTVGASPNPATFGQAVILTATVVPSVTGTQATGAVTFFDGANSLGAANLSNNAAQISVANFALGSHSITATYAGDRNFAGSASAAIAEVVNPAATSTVVTSSANPALVKANVTFTATVSSSTAGTQSGTVNFYLDGSGTAAASVNLSNGTAKYSTNSLSAGNHSVVAVFTSSNAGFAGSTSSSFTQFVSDFTVDASPTSLTVARSTSGTYTLTVTPVGEFSGTVSLQCGGAPGGTTCAIAPTQVTLNGSSSVQATVTITAAQNASKGTHNLTFTGTSGGLNHKITASLTID